MYTTIERCRKCHPQSWALSNPPLFVVAVAAALSYTATALAPFTDPSIEYRFDSRRCTAAQAIRRDHESLCDPSCTGTDDPRVGCSWSWPIDEPLGNKSDQAACRCNPSELRWGSHVKDPKKCDNQCAEGVDCMNSWPFYIFKPIKAERKNRCRGPLIEGGNPEFAGDSGDDSDDIPTDPPAATNPEPVEAIPEDRRIPLDASNVLMTSDPPSADLFGDARSLTRLVEEPVSAGLHD